MVTIVTAAINDKYNKGKIISVLNSAHAMKTYGEVEV
jgi:hypothetical protein